jgi:hypothetical protein
MMHGIFEEFKVVMQWERRHFEQLKKTVTSEATSPTATRSTTSGG